jgi:hypothetical protein
MRISGVRWGLRVGLMFFVGVVPAVTLLFLLLVILPLTVMIPGMLWFLAAAGLLGLLGVVGLWGATFRDAQERALRNSVAVPCVLAGLIPAIPYFVGIVRDSLGDDLLSTVAALLIGPITCSFYFLLEQLAHRLRSQCKAPNNSLERDAAKPRASG